MLLKIKMIFNIQLIENHKHAPCHLDSLLTLELGYQNYPQAFQW